MRVCEAPELLLHGGGDEDEDFQRALTLSLGEAPEVADPMAAALEASIGDEEARARRAGTERRFLRQDVTKYQGAAGPDHALAKTVQKSLETVPHRGPTVLDTVRSAQGSMDPEEALRKAMELSLADMRAAPAPQDSRGAPRVKIAAGPPARVPLTTEYHSVTPEARGDVRGSRGAVSMGASGGTGSAQEDEGFVDVRTKIWSKEEVGTPHFLRRVRRQFGCFLGTVVEGTIEDLEEEIAALRASQGGKDTHQAATNARALKYKEKCLSDWKKPPVVFDDIVNQIQGKYEFIQQTILEANPGEAAQACIRENFFSEGKFEEMVKEWLSHRSQ